MKDTDIVCDCANVTVADVKAYLEVPENQDRPLEEQLEDMDIGQACRMCKEKDCDRIDVHYSEIVK
jgi:hypothetical protein